MISPSTQKHTRHISTSAQRDARIHALARTSHSTFLLTKLTKSSNFTYSLHVVGSIIHFALLHSEIPASKSF